jgi:hypothetical protein
MLGIAVELNCSMLHALPEYRNSERPDRRDKFVLIDIFLDKGSVWVYATKVLQKHSKTQALNTWFRGYVHFSSGVGR